MHCMTEKQAEAEIRYRLAKFLLFRLQEENLLTPEESEKARQALCKKYKPFTYSLEVDEPWMNGNLPVYHWFCLKLEETFWK